MNLNRYLVVSLFSLTLAANTGILLRFGLVMGMPAWTSNFSAVRHAHSHLMYFGWVTLGLMALIWHYLPTLTDRSVPRAVGVQMAASALLALLSFPAFWFNGYGLTQIGPAELPLGAIISGLNGILWIVFTILYFRTTWRLPERSLPIKLWDWAIVLLLIAFGGALGLAGTVVADSDSIALQQIFLHLFLDLFAVGWFNLALLGLLWAWLGEHAPPLRWLPSQSLALFVVPTFLLGVSPIFVSDALFWGAAVANAGAAALLACHLYTLWQRKKHLPLLAHFGLVILSVHIIGALFILWPNFWRWSAGTQLRIFFLHNFLLGWVSSVLLGVIMTFTIQWERRLEKIISVIWAAGVAVMLLALLGVGFIQFLPVSVSTLLWIAAWSSVALSMAGLLVLNRIIVK